MPKILVFTILLVFGVNASSQLLKISEIQGVTAVSPYDNKTVSTRGAVTGVYKDGYFIRDNAEEWCGIYIYDPGRDPMPRLGDTVSLSGLVDEYFEWTEIKNITNFTIVSSGNPIPEPVIITAEEVSEGWESCLLTLENVLCTNTNLGYGEWEVEDASGTLVINDLGIPYTPELGQEYTLTGNLSFSFEFFKLEPRDLNDIQILAPVYFMQQPYAKSIITDAVEIAWITNSESSTAVEWGYTDGLEMGLIQETGLSVEHSIVIDNLAPATVIYVQAFSESGEGDANSKLCTFITASESSGEIRVAFNRTYTNQNFEEEPELFTHSLADTIIKYIGMAEQTLDIVFYDFTDHADMAEGYSSGIAAAMEHAANNGVQVRFITDADVASAAPGGQGTNIPRLDIAHDGIMHHKFIIVDHQSVNNSWIVTGSTNPNYNNLVMDFNNLISVQDQSLAKAFLIEFNELWGGSGVQPDAETSRSGSMKSDNSPHQFIINGRYTELFFSPSDHTTSQIAGIIKKSTTMVDFSMMAFTENALGDAIVAAHNNGALVRGIIDYVEYSGSEFNYLKGAGLDILDFINPDGTTWPNGPTLHHKFAIVDAGGESAALITGSHNWTASAESRNDENTLIIYDDSIVGLFEKEFTRIRDWLMNPPVRPVLKDDYFVSYNLQALQLDVVSNDIIAGDFIIELVSKPKYGKSMVLEDLSIEYVPGNDFGVAPDSFQYSVTLTGYKQFSDSAWIVVSATPDDVELRDIGASIHVYPNPAKGVINVASDIENGISRIQVYDAVGRIILSKDADGEFLVKLNISYVIPGIYYLDIQTTDHQHSIRKIVVE